MRHARKIKHKNIRRKTKDSLIGHDDDFSDAEYNKYILVFSTIRQIKTKH